MCKISSNISRHVTWQKLWKGFSVREFYRNLKENRSPSVCVLYTTDTLLFLLQPFYEALDSGNPCARFFIADFSKGFDRIDHQIRMNELVDLDIHLVMLNPVMLNWIAAFLANRKQVVRIYGPLSNWRYPNGGMPQGNNLGVILFSVMTNNLLYDWHKLPGVE